jgi:vacuolar iron transporter family protein
LEPEPHPRTSLWLENLRDEQDGIALYEGLAQLERDPERARAFQHLADGERRHAAIWQKKLERAGASVPAGAPSARTRVLLGLARLFGTQRVLPLVVQNEAADVGKYSRQGGDAAGLALEEQAHEDELRRLIGKGRPSARAAIGERESWHRGGRAGSLRAAIFGMNDGLLSNLSLVLGVAAAGVERSTLLVTGFAGLFAGAFSMAVGEFMSVSSQRDFLLRQVELERRELTEAPEEEASEIVALLRQKGLSEEQARRTAEELMKNPEAALDTLVREELGLDPADLGSPFGAAVPSFLMFVVGAAVPLLPFLLVSGRGAVVGSTVLCALVLAAVGAMVGLLSGTSAWRSALRMLALGMFAAGVTFGIGRLVGTALG